MNNSVHESVSEAPEAECAIIMALLSREDGNLAAEVVYKAVEPRYFHDRGRQRIFSTMREIRSDGGIVDKTTVAALLRQRGQLEMAGGPEALTFNSELIVDEAHLQEWIRSLHEAWASREVQRLGNEMLHPASPRPAIDVLAEAQERLTGVANVLKGGSRRKLWTFEPQARIFEQRPPAPEWDVQGLLPKEDGPALLYGPPDSFKSYIALHIAASMATGDPVFGQFKVPEIRTTVLFLNFDAGSKAFRRRSFKLGKGIDTLLIESPDGFDQAEYEATLEEFRGAWIAADCVSDMYLPSPDMEPAADTRRFYRAQRKLFENHELGGMLLDHTNRSGQGADAYYGSVQKHGALRNMWHVDTVKNLPHGVHRVKLTCFKLSEDEKWAPIYLDVRFEDDRFFVEYAGDATDDGFDLKALQDFQAVANVLRITPKSKCGEIELATRLPERRVRAALADPRIEAYGAPRSPSRCYSLRDGYESDAE